MSRGITIVMALLAAGLVAWAIVVRSCSPSQVEGVVLALDPPRIHTIRLRTGAGTFDLRRRGTEWLVTTDNLRDRADPTLPRELAELARGIFYHDRIPSSDIRSREDLAEFGLRSPRQWIEFHGDGPARRLLLGKETAAEGRIYARLDGSNEIYVIDDTPLQMLPSDLGALRAKTLTDLNASQADRIIIRESTGAVELVREGVSWRLATPLSAPADPATVGAFLKKFLEAPVLAFIADDSGDLGFYGIEEGKFEVAVYVEGRDRPLVLRFGYLPDEFPNTVLAQFTGRDSIMRLPLHVRELLNFRPDDFRDRRLFPINIDTVDMIRVTHPDGSFELRRQGMGWELVQGEAPPKPVSPSAIARLVDVLAASEVLEFSRQPLPEEIADLRVGFYAILSENTPEATSGTRLIAEVLLANHPEDDTLLRAAVSTTPGSSVVTRDILVGLPRDPADWVLPAETRPPQ